MGLTFKENCADIRNSGIQIVITKLKKLNCKRIFMILGQTVMKLKTHTIFSLNQN